MDGAERSNVRRDTGPVRREPGKQVQTTGRGAGRAGVLPPGNIPDAVTPSDINAKPASHGDVLTAVSDGLVALLKEYYGRGPTQAKSYYEDDLVVCVLRGGFLAGRADLA